MDPAQVRAMLVKDLNLEGVSPEEQERTLDEFGEAALRRAMRTVYERLPAEARAQFAALGEKGDHIALAELLKKHIPDMEALVQAEVRHEVASFKESRDTTERQ